ncbi:hypothetical protein ACLB2K_010161 [Fragaria x ananassa]
MAKVKIICTRTVVSTKPVEVEKCHSLSVLDRIMEKKHLRMVLYYASMGVPEPGEVTRRRRESISDALTSFPIMTGRLARNERGQWTSKFNDAGVRMVEARAKGSLEEWLRNMDREKELMLVYWEEMDHRPLLWSTFYLTEFEDGGLAIGLSCNHLLADPTSATMFLKAWADASFPGKLLQPPFFHPLLPRRSGNKKLDHKPYTSLINHYKDPIKNCMQLPANKSHTTVAFAISDSMVRACITMAQPIGATNRSKPSPFEALAGLFWFCISKVKGIGNELINMSICMDMRTVLGLDKGFFGNCMVYNKVHQEGFQGNNLSEAVSSIGEVVAKMDCEGIMDLIEWLEHTDDQCPLLMNDSDLICASLEAVDPFSTVFEDGNAPIRVSYYVEPVLRLGQVLIFPAKPGDGELSRVAMVTLPHDEMAKLHEDELVRRLSPTIFTDMHKIKTS